MQLQKRLNRKVGDVEYSKWQVVIPPDTIEKLGWKEGEELLEQVDDHKLTLVPKSKVNERSKPRNFDDDIKMVTKSRRVG